MDKLEVGFLFSWKEKTKKDYVKDIYKLIYMLIFSYFKEFSVLFIYIVM